MTPEQRQQIAKAKAEIAKGATYKDLIEAGFAHAAANIAFGRDPENLCPYGANNGPVGE